MDLVEGLRSFCAVAAERSFTRGAQRCGQPQPVASRRIAALEDKLGVALFRRTSRRVELSPDGALLLPLAGELISRADRIEQLFSRATPGLAIGVPDGLAAQDRATIRRGLPGLDVVFAAAEPADRAQALAAGATQLAVLPVAAASAELCVPLGVAHLELRPTTRFHLEQLRRPVRMRDLPAQAVHILAEDDVPTIRDRLRDAAERAGLRADQLTVGLYPEEAWTRVHERGDVVLCSRAAAERENLAWAELVIGGDEDRLVRAYRLVGDCGLDDAQRVALAGRLARGLGGTCSTRAVGSNGEARSAESGGPPS